MFEVFRIGGANRSIGTTPNFPIFKPTSRVTYLIRKLVNQPNGSFNPYYAVRTDDLLDEDIAVLMFDIKFAMMAGRSAHFGSKIVFRELKTIVEDGKKVRYFAVGIEG